MTTRSLLAIAALALAVTACGSDGPTGNNGPEGQGSFTGTISGDISRSITGHAVFGTSATNDSYAFVLGDEDNGIIFGREQAGLLAVGSHAVFDLVNDDESEAPASALLGIIGLTVNGADHICTPSGGTVTVTSSTSTRMTGSLSVPAACYTSGSETPKTITITGTFTAVGAPVD